MHGRKGCVHMWPLKDYLRQLFRGSPWESFTRIRGEERLESSFFSSREELCGS